jgi:ParB-like nuclease domain
VTAARELTQLDLNRLRPYPGNARRGDVDAIAASLQRNGQFQPLVVQRSTSFVLSGNHTMEAMRRLGWQTADAYLVDVDDDTARRIVIAANRTADLGTYDDRALLQLLREVGEDLDGTGYDLDDYDDLLAALEEADDPPDEPAVLLPHAGQSGAYGEGSDGSNVRTTPSYAEYEAGYAARATRFLALIYPLAQYAWVVEKLSKAAADRGLDSNSAVLLALLADAYGEDPPAPDAAVTAEQVAAAEQAAEEAPPQ